MADAFAFAVLRPRFRGLHGARAPFGALLSALNRSFSRLSSALRHISPIAAAHAAPMTTRARIMFISIATN